MAMTKTRKRRRTFSTDQMPPLIPPSIATLSEEASRTMDVLDVFRGKTRWQRHWWKERDNEKTRFTHEENGIDVDKSIDGKEITNHRRRADLEEPMTFKGKSLGIRSDKKQHWEKSDLRSLQAIDIVIPIKDEVSLPLNFYEIVSTFEGGN
eukprot:1071603-Ditylum_brightwellii.AAC.1